MCHLCVPIMLISATWVATTKLGSKLLECVSVNPDIFDWWKLPRYQSNRGYAH